LDSHLNPSRSWERVKTFAPLMPISAFLNSITILQTFHPFDLSLTCWDFLMEFQLKVNLDFTSHMFMLTFIHTTFQLEGFQAWYSSTFEIYLT
jgi:hypothetical protein